MSVLMSLPFFSPFRHFVCELAPLKMSRAPETLRWVVAGLIHL